MWPLINFCERYASINLKLCQFLVLTWGLLIAGVRNHIFRFRCWRAIDNLCWLICLYVYVFTRYICMWVCNNLSHSSIRVLANYFREKCLRDSRWWTLRHRWFRQLRTQWALRSEGVKAVECDCRAIRYWIKIRLRYCQWSSIQVPQLRSTRRFHGEGDKLDMEKRWKWFLRGI